jgi:hypothetical protein
MEARIPYGGPFAYHGAGTLSQPAPSPSPATQAHRAEAPLMDTKTERALHSLADLLLTGPVEYTSASESSPAFALPGRADDSPLPPHRVELVLVGRVPGYAGAWLSQYTVKPRPAGRWHLYSTTGTPLISRHSLP